MNKRTFLILMLALVLFKGRALFLWMMDFLSSGGGLFLLGFLLSFLLIKGIRKTCLIGSLYLVIMLALWLSNAFFAPYETKSDYSSNELIQLCENLIEVSNASYSTDFDKDAILVSACSVMKTGNAKVFYFPWPEVMNTLKLSGIFVPFTGYSVINRTEYDFLLPFVASHEIAHLNGFLSEAQANMHAYRMCMDSGIREFQYSASLYALRYALNDLYSRNETEYLRLIKSLSDGVFRDFFRIGVHTSDFKLLDYSGIVPCLIQDQSIMSHGVI